METFFVSLALYEANPQVTLGFPSRRPVTLSLWSFSMICAWTNGWENNRDAGDLRRHHAQYDITVMNCNNHNYFLPAYSIFIPMLVDGRGLMNREHYIDFTRGQIIFSMRHVLMSIPHPGVVSTNRTNLMMLIFKWITSIFVDRK